MKKLVAPLLTLLISSSAYALPIGNPWEASLMYNGVFWEGHCADYRDPCINWCDGLSVRLGFYGDYVFNRHMEVSRHEGHASIHDTEIWTNAGYVAFNMWDRFDIFATLGTTQLQIFTPQSAFSTNSNVFIRVETETDFSWSLGMRGTIWECGCFALGGEAQYFQTRPDINFTQLEAKDPLYSDKGEKLKFKEWQIGLGAAYRINITSCVTAVIPYLGVKWGHTWIDMDDKLIAGGHLFDLRNERDFGYAFGLTLLGCNKTSITVETRFIDEKALYVNGQFRF